MVQNVEKLCSSSISDFLLSIIMLVQYNVNHVETGYMEDV